MDDLYVFGLNKARGYMNDEWGGVRWWGGGEYMNIRWVLHSRYMGSRKKAQFSSQTRHPQKTSETIPTRANHLKTGR